MLEILNISKSYNSSESTDSISVLSSISLDVEQGEIVSIFGPNGSGKSTLLNIIAGILKPDSGQINHNSKETTIGYVWQNYSASLFPWYSVKENIELPVLLSKKKLGNRNKALTIFKKLGFKIRLDAYPYQLSGGQQQMVAITRALCDQPSVIILDEPFSALDQKKKEAVFVGLHEYFKSTKPTVFFVSHSLDEAILFSDRLVLISDIPSRIIGDIGIKLKNERTESLLTTSQFIKYRNQALQIINKK